MNNVKQPPFLIPLINLSMLISVCAAGMTASHPTLAATRGSAAMSMEHPPDDYRAGLAPDHAIERYDTQRIFNTMTSGIIIGDRCLASVATLLNLSFPRVGI